RLGRGDRVFGVPPHPDDEALACGGLIQRARKMRLPVRVVFLTYGDSNEWSFAVYRKHPVVVPRAVRAMGLVRHDEAVAADRILGLDPAGLTFLGYPDFGTFEIWTEHWGEKPPLRSKLTRVTAVPYPSAFRPGAPAAAVPAARHVELAGSPAIGAGAQAGGAPGARDPVPLQRRLPPLLRARERAVRGLPGARAGRAARARGDRPLRPARGADP